jgi:UDP-3-O-[3-hydroxymyristoyl] N-acetylglucosamine deacetylase
MYQQQTIRNQVTFSGVGLHSGVPVAMTLRPAAAGTGIVFHRTDLAPSVSIEARAANVVNTRLSTTIGAGGAVVATIEHLMAALRGLEVDNVHIDINGPEVPIMDGSAACFVAAIRDAGIRPLDRSRCYLVVKRPVTVRDGDKCIAILPARAFRVSFDMRFSHPVVGDQFRSTRVQQDSFVNGFAPARTFGLLSEVEMLKANGLARGGSLDNAVVIGDDGILNPEGLRFGDEFVRHKILDAIGDLSLAGHYLIGHVRALRSGHDLNHRLVTELLGRPECWQLVDFSQPLPAPPYATLIPELSWAEG